MWVVRVVVWILVSNTTELLQSCSGAAISTILFFCQINTFLYRNFYRVHMVTSTYTLVQLSPVQSPPFLYQIIIIQGKKNIQYIWGKISPFELNRKMYSLCNLFQCMNLLLSFLSLSLFFRQKYLLNIRGGKALEFMITYYELIINNM